MVRFQPFQLERIMSEWENVVEYNLSESGAHPATLAELLGDELVIDDLLATGLNYPQVEGTRELRERIAALYQDASPDNVLVTVGCAEANFITVQTLLEPGDEMAVMLPNYMQVWGIGHNCGYQVKTFRLQEERTWALDVGGLRDVVTPATRLIAVCNPNNPTGKILTEAEMDSIVVAADRVGAWILADEVYSGAERLTDGPTPSFWGRYGRVLATNSLSKAYGLPGLRIGWVLAPAETRDDIWRRHEYTTISATMLSNKLATVALSPRVRPRLMRRVRDYIRQGFAIFEEWLSRHGSTFSLVPPQAAAIAFPRYHLDVSSVELVDRLIHEKSVLVAPGAHFGVDHHLRISFGLPPDFLRAGLDRIHEMIVELRDA
ncbi:MAG: aminotransferase class I/II-fold pyridoxal phosphate-dependent enzyme [Anaerolineae bacterium]|jgi:aspartate/methionine/tyrosine aminotransferase